MAAILNLFFFSCIVCYSNTLKIVHNSTDSNSAYKRIHHSTMTNREVAINVISNPGLAK